MSSDLPIRKMPAYIILVLDIIALIAISFSDSLARQDKILSTIGLQVLTVFFLFIWFAFMSRLPGALRLKGAIGFVVVCLGLSTIVEIRDFSGDILPVLAFKWTPRHDETLDSSSKTASPQATEIIVSETDYPRFLGATGTPVVKGLNLARSWAQTKPKKLWRIDIGAGCSGFVTVGDFAITQEQRGEEEMVTCYKLSTGEQIWAHSDTTRFTSSLGGDGPRSTPTIANGHVYSLGGTGLLTCLNIATGELVWSRNLEEEHKAPRPKWGHSSSPLIIGDLMVVSIGGPDGHSLVAHNAKTGEPVWSAGDDVAGYSSPFLHELAGVPQILTFTTRAVMSHDPVDGHVLWDYPFGEGTPNVANPLPINDHQVLVSAGYGDGSVLLSVSSGEGGVQVKEEYKSSRLKAKFANYVHLGDSVYGLDDGVLVSMKVADGSRNWKRGRYGHGQLILADDLLLVQTEEGTLFLIPANPEKAEITGEMQVLNNKSWNNMALSGNRLLMRNQEEAVCLELPLAD